MQWANIEFASALDVAILGHSGPGGMIRYGGECWLLKWCFRRWCEVILTSYKTGVTKPYVHFHSIRSCA